MKTAAASLVRRMRLPALLGAAFLVNAPLSSAALIFDRGLPVQNVNPAAGLNRSNSAAASPLAEGVPATVVGDDFLVPDAGFSYFSGHFVQGFRFWVLTSYENPGAGRGLLPFLGDALERLDIWFGAPSSPLPLLHSIALTPGSNATGNADVTITPVMYPTTPPENYIGAGPQRQMFQVDVTGLNLRIYDGDQLAFASFGTSVADAGFLMFLHVSNGTLGGNLYPELWNGRFMRFDPALLTLLEDAEAPMILPALTDVNVEVFGVAVPEPGAYAAVLALGGLALALRRRRS